MKDVLRHIFEHKRDYTNLPLFNWMRDERVDAIDRLAFYPCMAHFIMTFGDLNRIVLRADARGDAYQEMVNQHTLEDDHHWPWYLEDFTKLGFDAPAAPSDVMRFLWGQETEQNRILAARLIGLIEGTSGLERLVLIEAIEETGNVLFGTILPLAQELEQRFGMQLRYLGAFHFEKESGHAVNSDADHRALAAVKLTTEQRAHSKHAVDLVFSHFEEWTHELHRYALAHPLFGKPATLPAAKAPSESATFRRAEAVTEELAELAARRRG